MSDNLLAKVDEVDGLLAQTTNVRDARKLLILADTVTNTASRLYSNVNKVSECKEDKERALSVAQKAGSIRLKVEARLGELIKVEQEAGRLASQETGRPKNKCASSVTHTTLKDVGLTRKDSQRAQMVADNKNLIAEIVEEAKNEGDVPTRKDLEKKVKQIQKTKRLQKEQQQALTRLKVTAQIKNQRAIDLLNSLDDKSVDLLLTDPPYSTEIEDMSLFIQSWLFKALDKLKDSGVAYIFIGAYAWELREYLNALKTVEKRFGEPQILVWTYKNTLGPNPQNHYSQNWQAILYIRGPKAGKINEEQLTSKLAVQEFNAPDARTGARFYKWEKPIDLAKRFIQQSTTPDAIVIDPFAGSGTFLLASAELGRTNYGSEIMPDILEIAKTRGCVQTG